MNQLVDSKSHEHTLRLNDEQYERVLQMQNDGLLTIKKDSFFGTTSFIGLVVYVEGEFSKQVFDKIYNNISIE